MPKRATGEAARRALARNVVRLRADAGWSQAELAIRSGVSRVYISRIENNGTKVSIDIASRLAAAFRVNLTDILS